MLCIQWPPKLLISVCWNQGTLCVITYLMSKLMTMTATLQLYNTSPTRDSWEKHSHRDELDDPGGVCEGGIISARWLLEEGHPLWRESSRCSYTGNRGQSSSVRCVLSLLIHDSILNYYLCIFRVSVCERKAVIELALTWILSLNIPACIMKLDFTMKLSLLSILTRFSVLNFINDTFIV